MHRNIHLSGLEPFVVNHVGSAINSLLKKRDLLTRDDLVVEWRPLYVLYERLFHTNLESLGLIKLPHSLGPTVSSLIKYSRPYFPFEATEVTHCSSSSHGADTSLSSRRCWRSGGPSCVPWTSPWGRPSPTSRCSSPHIPPTSARTRPTDCGLKNSWDFGLLVATIQHGSRLSWVIND